MPWPRFTPGERTPGTQCTGGWVGPRAGLDTEARGKILCPRRGSNSDRPDVQPVVRHYTAWANPAPHYYCKEITDLCDVEPKCYRTGYNRTGSGYTTIPIVKGSMAVVPRFLSLSNGFTRILRVTEDIWCYVMNCRQRVHLTGRALSCSLTGQQIKSKGLGWRFWYLKFHYCDSKEGCANILGHRTKIRVDATTTRPPREPWVEWQAR
jgi:hypothetical protein